MQVKSVRYEHTHNFYQKNITTIVNNDSTGNYKLKAEKGTVIYY